MAMFYIFIFYADFSIDCRLSLMGTAVNTKNLFRNELLSRRRSLTEDAWRRQSAAVISEAMNIAELAGASCIMVYLSIMSSREVATDKLCGKLHEAGKRITVPVVAENRLLPVHYMPGDPLTCGSFGQPEPVRRVPVNTDDIDAVIVPIVGVDGYGRRLGYGKGFYDRFLGELAASGHSPCRIGLAFRMQFTPYLPADSWDEPLDYVVYEDGVVKFS